MAYGYVDEHRLYLERSGQAARDITAFVGDLTATDDITALSVELTGTQIVSPWDKYVPKIALAPGDQLRLRNEAAQQDVFVGQLVTVGLDGALTAYDRGWHVAFPCMQRAAAGQSMCMRTVSFADYRDGSVPFIKRPVTSFVPAPEDEARFPLIDPREIDVMAVPLVAFDDTGARLGYGGGNYDRYLPLLRPDCLVAGVAFAEQRVDRVPVEPHDRPLPRIIWA